MEKTCTKCGKEYPATTEYFYQHNTGKGGLRPDCKNCVLIARATQRKKNKGYQYKYEKRWIKTLRGYVVKLTSNIKQRCTNPNRWAYKNYGNRGIKCLFASIELYNWLISNGIDPRGKHIHRIDHDGDYTLGNIECLDASEHMKLHREKLVCG